MKRLLIALLLGVLTVACSDDPAPIAPPNPIIDSYAAEIAPEVFLPFDYLPAKKFGGEWTLEITDGTFVIETESFRVTEKWAGTGSRFHITASPSPIGAYNCHDEAGERLTGEGEAAAEYRVTLDDDELTFVAEEEPCEIRGLLLARTWNLAANTGD